MSSSLKTYLKRHRKKVDQALHRFLPSIKTKPTLIHQAMRYSVFAGGKRLRPILVIAGAEACGGKASYVMPVACALELIHTYSLVHDDLPAMDDDDLRRGRPTNHKVYGEDMAILAGDALLTHAFSLVEKNATVRGIQPKAIPAVLNILTTGAGTQGMIGGQVADIKADKGRWKKLKKGKETDFSSPQQLLQFIHLKKTAALISTSLTAGASLSGGSAAQIRRLDQFGRYIGLAFQVRDDILDLVGDKKKLGKKGSDKANNKLTYPALYGLAQSEKMAQTYLKKAHRCLQPFGRRGRILKELADYVLRRDH